MVATIGNAAVYQMKSLQIFVENLRIDVAFFGRFDFLTMLDEINSAAFEPGNADALKSSEKLCNLAAGQTAHPI